MKLLRLAHLELNVTQGVLFEVERRVGQVRIIRAFDPLLRGEVLILTLVCLIANLGVNWKIQKRIVGQPGTLVVIRNIQ